MGLPDIVEFDNIYDFSFSFMAVFTIFYICIDLNRIGLFLKTW